MKHIILCLLNKLRLAFKCEIPFFKKSRSISAEKYMHWNGNLEEQTNNVFTGMGSYEKLNESRLTLWRSTEVQEAWHSRLHDALSNYWPYKNNKHINRMLLSLRISGTYTSTHCSCKLRWKKDQKCTKLDSTLTMVYI